MAKGYKTTWEEDCNYTLCDKLLLECFLHRVKWQDKVSVLGYVVVVQLHFRHFVFHSSSGFSRTGRSGSLSDTVRPATRVRHSCPYRGCWCCCHCRCCWGTYRLPGPDERDRQRHWTLCWSAPLTASTSLGLRHSASGWTLTGMRLKIVS